MVAQRLRYNTPPVSVTSWITKLLLVAVGVVLWRVFFPAIMIVDSITQFQQAWDGRFNDWHPPLLAVVLHLFLRAGRSVGALVLVQCLAGLLGVRALAVAWLRAFFGPGISPRWAEAIAVLTVLVLFLPVSPLPFYLVTFWKDSWAAVILVWICAVSLRLVSEAPTGWRTWTRVAVLLALSAALGLVRHNAVVALPFFSLVLWIAARRVSLSRKAALGLAVAPLAAFVLARALLYSAFDIEESHHGMHVMALELVGVCAASEQACQELPYVRSFIRVPNLRERYVPGNIALTFWTEPPVFDHSALWNAQKFKAEYYRAVWKLPGPLARVKFEAFKGLLGLHGPHNIIFTGIHANPYGLHQNPRFQAVRDRWAVRIRGTGDSLVLRWFSGVHLLWILVNAVWIVALLASGSRRPLAAVLLPPLALYLSYLLAAPSHDYRLMYPSTLTMQVVTFAWLCGMVAKRYGTPARATVRNSA